MAFGRLGVAFGRLGGGGKAGEAVPDEDAPTVSSFSPLDNATDVAADTDLVVTFNENIVLGASGTITLKKTSDDSTLDSWDVSSDAGSGAGQVEVSGATLTLHPTTDLDGSTEMYVVWDEGIVTDPATNDVAALSTTTTWSFTTAAAPDVTAPTVSSFSPADNATDAAINVELVVTFNETVTLGASGTITLKKTSDNSTIDSWDVSADGGSGAGQVEVLSDDELHLHLTTDLANETEYYVIWDAGVVKDGSDNNVAALSTTTTWSFTTVAAEAGYEGPGDIVAGAHSWYGLRAYDEAYAAAESPIVDITDQADGNALTVNATTAGDLDVAAIAAWVTANSVTTIRVTKIYDQSGNAYHLENGTPEQRATLVLNVVNGKPALLFTSSASQVMTKSTGVAQLTQPFTFSHCSVPNVGAGAGAVLAIYDGGSDISLVYYDNGSALIHAGSGVGNTAADDTFHSVQGVLNGASSIINIDGTETTGLNAGTNVCDTNIKMGDNFFGAFFNGYVCEAGTWDAGFDGTQRSNMNANQEAYWT